MSDPDLHTLTGAYALDALSAPEAAEFERHLARCEACAREVRELRETAARLAVAVAEVPPAGLRSRVMAALPEVRQHPPDGPGATVVSMAARRWRQRLPYVAAAACLVLAAVAGGLAVHSQQEADRARDRSARAERQASELNALMAAPDATFRSAALRGGGTGTVVASRRFGRAAFAYHGLPRLPEQRVYQLWYSHHGSMVPAGLLGTGSTSGTTALTGAPRDADGVGVTVEPAGGSRTPTTEPLVLLAL